MAKNHSFIRWAGGKSWFVDGVKDLIKDIQFNNYLEPFMGGASIFFALDIPHQAFLSDINEELVTTFVQIRDNLEEVKNTLKKYKTDKDSYYKIRDIEPTTDIEIAARFLYLNFYSFNGIYRVNSRGKYNVPYGRRTGEFNYDRLDPVSEKLQDVDIRCQDFMDSDFNIGPGDLVFLDPPYTVSSKTGENDHFIAYNATLFSLEDQRRLKDLIDSINEKGAYYILTNAHHETIAKIFEGDLTLEYDRTCNIGGKSAKRGKVQEYIFTNIPQGNNNNGEEEV